MNERKMVLIDGQPVEVNFPSMALANQLQKLLDVYIFRDIKKIDEDPLYFTHNLDTDEKTLSALKIMIPSATLELARTLAPPDISNLCTVFFSGMTKRRLRLNSESKPSDASPTTGQEASPQKDTSLKSPSIQLVEGN